MFEQFTHFQFTFLNCLSVLAFITTVGLFFCGIPICRQIWKRKDTSEIAGAPFLMGVLGGTCWLTYGYLKGDHTVMYVTMTQVFLYSTYCVFYFFMTKQKKWITIKIVALITTCASLIAATHFFGHKIFHPLGVVCMTLNAMDFGAPMAGLKTVIRRKATSTLPLPLCIANFLVSTEWFIYGLLVWDFYLITPNGIGCVLATAQLILFIVLPRKPGQKSPIVRLFTWLSLFVCPCLLKKDADTKTVVEKDLEEGEAQKGRWSERMIDNVTGGIENVMHKVHFADPFAYTEKIEPTDDTTSETITLTPDSTVGHPNEDEKPVQSVMNIFSMSLRDEGELQRIAKQLHAKLHQNKPTNLEKLTEKQEEKKEEEDEKVDDKIKRWQSAPDLRL